MAEIKNEEYLLAHLREHVCDFYRRRWGDARSFEDLPYVSAKDLQETPLPERRYKEKKSFVKIVSSKAGEYLSEWSFQDLTAEPLGEMGARPMVYLKDPHEALEKAMWCYLHNKVPLVGEKDPEMAIFAAQKYQVDSLITDYESLQKLLPFLKLREPLVALTVVGTHFPESQVLAPLAKQVRCLLSLPETGIIAERKEGWETIAGQRLEVRGDVLVVTRFDVLVTPIVRYETELLVQEYPGLL